MSGSWHQQDAKCPFYIRDDGHARITCEGHYDTSRTSYSFGGKSDFDRHFRQCCCDIAGCLRCVMYRSIMQYKYEGQG